MTRSIRLKPRLKEAREAKGLSQAALGRLLMARRLPGFRSNHVGLLELGYRDATPEELTALAAELQVDPAWLAGTGAAPPAPPADPAPPAIGAGMASANGSTQKSERVPAPPPPLRLPPGEVPARQGAAEALYREQLGRLLTHATGMLNDRSLVPAEWRAWRTHVEQLKAALRAV